MSRVHAPRADDSDIFAGSADVNDSHGIHYGNPNDPVDQNADAENSQPEEYVPMYQRQLAGDEKQAWDLLVAEEMRNMEMEFSDEAARDVQAALPRQAQYEPQEQGRYADFNDSAYDEKLPMAAPQQSIDYRDGQYGTYQQLGEVKLKVPDSSNHTHGFAPVGQRNSDAQGGGGMPSVEEQMKSLEYNRAHPTTVAVATRAPPRISNNSRRVQTPEATILSGIGSSAPSDTQKRQQKLNLAAQQQLDLQSREAYARQAAVGDEEFDPLGGGAQAKVKGPSPKKKPTIDRSYRTQREEEGESYEGSMDQLAGSSRVTPDSKRAKQQEYQEQLRRDAEVQQQMSARASSHPRGLDSPDKPSVHSNTGRPTSRGPEAAAAAKRQKQEAYARQLQEQSSANEREKREKEEEVRERRLQQQRDRDMEMLQQQDEQLRAQLAAAEEEKEEAHAARVRAVRAQQAALAEEEAEKLRMREQESKQQAARQAMEQGRSKESVFGMSIPTVPLAERAERLVKRERQERYRAEMERDQEAMQRANPEVVRRPAPVVSRKEQMDAYVQSASTSTTDIFNSMGGYQHNKEDKSSIKSAQEEYVNALAADSSAVLPDVSRLGLRHLKEERNHFAEEQARQHQEPLPRAAMSQSIAEPSYGGGAGTEEINEKHFKQLQYAQQLQADAATKELFSPRKPFSRKDQDEDHPLSGRGGDSARVSRYTRKEEQPGFWPEGGDGGAGGLFSNGLQAAGPATKHGRKIANQTNLREQLQQDAQERNSARANYQETMRIENRNTLKVGQPQSDVGGKNGGVIGFDPSSSPSRQVEQQQPRAAQRSPRRAHLAQPEQTGLKLDSCDVTTALRLEETQRSRQDYVQQLQSDAQAPQIEHSRVGLHEQRQQAKKGSLPEYVGHNHSQHVGTGFNIGADSADVRRAEREKRDFYEAQRRADQEIKPIQATRRVSPRRPDPSVQRAMAQAEQLRKLEATGAQLSATERELLDTYNMSLRLESMEPTRGPAPSSEEYSAYNKARTQYNNGNNAERMGSERLTNENVLAQPADARAQKRQAQQDYARQLDESRNLPSIAQSRVPMLEIKRDNQERTGLPGPGQQSTLARAGSAGAEGNSGRQLSGRDYQIQRSQQQAQQHVMDQHGGGGYNSVTDVMATGAHARLPNWGKSVGGGPSSFSISGALPQPSKASGGAHANGFSVTGDNRGQGGYGGQEQQLSPRSQRIARKGSQSAMVEKLYQNPLGY